MAVGVGDLRSLPLAPVDGFVLSRVNGTATLRDIAAQTGLHDDAVLGSLTKLQSLGIVEFVGEASGGLPAAPAKPPPEPVREPPRLVEIAALGPPAYDLRELDAEADLTAEEKKRILDLFYRLDDVNYFQLLGVARSADRNGS